MSIMKASILAAFAMALSSTVWAGALTQMTLEMTLNTSDIFTGKVFAEAIQDFGAIYDVDGDGVKEIFFGTRKGDSRRFWCFDGLGNFRWVYPPIEMDGLPGDPLSQATFVDVDNDGQYEICFAGRGGRLHVLKPDGSIHWTWDNPVEGQQMLGAPQAYDVDGDGYIEFFISDNGGFIHRISHDGQLVWTSFQCGKANEGHPTIADIDKDGEYEVLWASQDHNLYCIDANTGTEEWRFDTGANMQTNQVIVADINNDEEYEALVWTDPPVSSVFAITFYGSELWRWRPYLETQIRICQAIGDVNKDGRMDMVVNTDHGQYCLDIAGTAPEILWYFNATKLAEEGLIPQRYGGHNGWSSYQLIADIDGDGELEVIVIARSEGCAPIVLDGKTGEVEAYYLDDRIKSITGGWFGDLDNDGKSEYAFYGTGFTHPQGQVYVVTLNGTFPAESPWHSYYHSALPAEDQRQAEWLTLKAGYSGSLWFPIAESALQTIPLVLVTSLLSRSFRRPSCGRARSPGHRGARQ